MVAASNHRINCGENLTAWKFLPEEKLEYKYSSEL